MNWENIIGYVISGLAIPLLLYFMNKGADKAVFENEKGEIELRMNKMYAILAYICLGFALLFTVGAIFIEGYIMYIMTGSMVLLFGGLGISMFLYYKNHFIKFDHERIVVINWRGERNELKWSEIIDIEFSATYGYIKIKGSHEKMKIHQHLVGLKEFIKKMEENTKWSAAALNLPF